MHARWLRHALCTCLLLISACDDAPDSPSAVDAGLDAGVQPDLGCQAADYLVSMRVGIGFAALGQCVEDRDCTSVSLPTVECGGGQVRLPNCNVAIASGSVDAGIALLRALESELCPRIMAPCHVGILCVPRQPSCVSGRCDMVPLDAEVAR